MPHDRFGVYWINHRVLCDLCFVYLRLREAVTMENILVGGIAVLLIVYLFWTLIRPEHF